MSFLKTLWSHTKSLRVDTTASAVVAGLIVVLVGMASSSALVFEAARSAGLDPSAASSWLGALLLGSGFISFFFSLYYKTPVLGAWATAGAALLITSLAEIPLSDAIGAFLFSALLFFISGVSGLFEKVMDRIPQAIASALLAGVLLHFSLDSFLSVEKQPVIVGGMILTYIVGRKFWPRWVMLSVLFVGIILAFLGHQMVSGKIEVLTTDFHFFQPTFSWQSLLSVGVPLFVVSMASQNLTGIAALRFYGYQTSASTLLSWAGFLTLLTAPLGGFTITLSAITASIAYGPEAHPDPKKRYVAGVVAGLVYLILGCLAGTITSIFAAFPREMILGIAGLALLSTVSSGMQNALSNEKQREAAFITFVVAASGVSLFGIGSAFWAIVVGVITQMIFDFRKLEKTI